MEIGRVIVDGAVVVLRRKHIASSESRRLHQLFRTIVLRTRRARRRSESRDKSIGAGDGGKAVLVNDPAQPAMTCRAFLFREEPRDMFIVRTNNRAERFVRSRG